MLRRPAKVRPSGPRDRLGLFVSSRVEVSFTTLSASPVFVTSAACMRINSVGLSPWLRCVRIDGLQRPAIHHHCNGISGICSRSHHVAGPRAVMTPQRDTTGNRYRALKVNVVLENYLSSDKCRSRLRMRRGTDSSASSTGHSYNYTTLQAADIAQMDEEVPQPLSDFLFPIMQNVRRSRCQPG